MHDSGSGCVGDSAPDECDDTVSGAALCSRQARPRKPATQTATGKLMLECVGSAPPPFSATTFEKIITNPDVSEENQDVWNKRDVSQFPQKVGCCWSAEVVSAVHLPLWAGSFLYLFRLHKCQRSSFLGKRSVIVVTQLG